MSNLTAWSPRVLSILRIMVALLFLQHGSSKFFGFPVPFPVPGPLPPLLMAAGTIEIVAGVLITFGLFTRPAAFIASGEMAIAYFMQHAPKSFYPLANNGEGAILFCFAFLYLVFAGPGPWSIDAMLGRRTRDEPPASDGLTVARLNHWWSGRIPLKQGEANMPNLSKSLALLGAAALAVSVSACERYEHRDSDHHAKADTGAIVDAIKADEKKWNEEFQAKPMNVDALTAHYADDATFVAPGLKAMSGIADIRKAYADAVKDPNFVIAFAADKVNVASGGDYAISQGHFTESYTDPATKQKKSDGGTFLTVYKKQDDGSWKAVQDWAVADPAA